MVKATKPDGTPARGIPIQRVLLLHNAGDNEIAGTTNDQGELRIPFNGQMTASDGSGWGEYRFLAMPDSYRWEMSPKYLWTHPPTTYAGASAEVKGYFDNPGRTEGTPRDNAGLGETIWATPDASNVWKISLQKGEDITVAVKDQRGEPVPNIKLGMQVDLCAPTHTGFGGEVNLPSVKTDKDGRFVIHHAAGFFYKFDAYSASYCSPTLDWWNTSVLAQFYGREGRLTFHKFTPKRLCVRVVDKNTRAPIEGAVLTPTEVGGGGIVQGGIGKTDKDGMFKTDRFLYFDLAFAVSIWKSRPERPSPDSVSYNTASIPMAGFDPAKDYLVELTPETK